MIMMLLSLTPVVLLVFVVTLLLPTITTGFGIVVVPSVVSNNKKTSVLLLHSSLSSSSLQINIYDGIKQQSQPQPVIAAATAATVTSKTLQPSYRYGKFTDLPTSTVVTTGADTVVPSLTTYSPSYDNHRTDFIHHPYGYTTDRKLSRYPITDTLMETRHTTSNGSTSTGGSSNTHRVTTTSSIAQLLDLNKLPKITTVTIPPGRISASAKNGSDAAWWLGPERTTDKVNTQLIVRSSNDYLSSYMKPKGKLSVSIHPPAHVDDDTKKK